MSYFEYIANENNRLSKIVLDNDLIYSLLDELGADHQYGAPIIYSTCPVGHSDKQKFQIYLDGDTLPIACVCYQREECRELMRGNLTGMVMAALTARRYGDIDGKKVTLREAIRWLQDFVEGHTRPGNSTSSPRPPDAARVPVAPRAPSFTAERPSFLEQLIIPSAYFMARGFSPDVLTRYSIGDCRGARFSDVRPSHHPVLRPRRLPGDRLERAIDPSPVSDLFWIPRPRPGVPYASR